MKCPACGGLMQLRRLTIDTDAYVCIICGRDNLPRKEAAPESDEDMAPSIHRSPHHKQRRTCPGCGRPNLIFSGRCQRCQYRAKRGLDLVTGHPVTTPQAALSIAVSKKETAMATSKRRGTCPVCKRPNLILAGTKCSRCYYRISQGKDPVTNQPTTAQDDTMPPTAATPPILPEKPVPVPIPDYPDRQELTLCFLGPDMAVYHALVTESSVKHRSMHEQAIHALSTHLKRKGRLRLEVE